MEVRIERVGGEKEELVVIRCCAVTEEVREIAAFVRSRQGSLSGVRDERQYEIAVSEIYYIESVDGKTFLYTKGQVYETPERLYAEAEAWADSFPYVDLDEEWQSISIKEARAMRIADKFGITFDDQEAGA